MEVVNKDMMLYHTYVPDREPRRIGLIHLPDEILLQILALLLEAFPPGLIVYDRKPTSKQSVHILPEIKDGKFLLSKKDVPGPSVLHAQILRVQSRLLSLGRSVLYGSNVFRITRFWVQDSSQLDKCKISSSTTPPLLDRNTDEHFVCLRHIFLTVPATLFSPVKDVECLASTARNLCCLRSVIIQRSWIGHLSLRRNAKGSSDRALDQRQLRQCYDYEDSGNAVAALKIFALLRDRQLRHDVLGMQRAFKGAGLRLSAIYDYQHMFRPRFYRDSPHNSGGTPHSTVENTIHFMRNSLDRGEALQSEALSRHYCRETFEKNQGLSRERCNCRFRRYEVDTQTGDVRWFEKNQTGLLGATQGPELNWVWPEGRMNVQ